MKKDDFHLEYNKTKNRVELSEQKIVDNVFISYLFIMQLTYLTWSWHRKQNFYTFTKY